MLPARQSLTKPGSARYTSAWLGLAVLVVVSLASGPAIPVGAQEAATTGEKKSSNESVEKTIETRDELAYDPTRRSLFPEFYHTIRNKLYEWERFLGLALTISYDVLVQGYVDNDEDLGGVAGDLTLSGRWLLFGNKYNKPVFLTFRVRTRDALTDYPPSEISEKTGLFWRTTDGFNDSGFQIPSFYISQELRDSTVILRYGQFSIDDFFDIHALRGAKRYFLNQAFSSNPTVNFPSFGAGFVGYWKINDRWEFEAGLSNIQATDTSREVDFKVDSSAIFKSLEGSYNFSGYGGQPAQLQILGWHSDAIDEEEVPEDRGMSFTLEHDGILPGSKYVLRYAFSNGESKDTDMLVFAGFGRDIRKFDSLGVGVGGGRSSDTGDWQTVIETYYRWQVTKELVITPDLQLILGEGLDRDSGLRFVGGLRMGILF